MTMLLLLLLLEAECMFDEKEKARARERTRSMLEERKSRFRLIGRRKKKDTLPSKQKKDRIDQPR